MLLKCLETIALPRINHPRTSGHTKPSPPQRRPEAQRHPAVAWSGLGNSDAAWQPLPAVPPTFPEMCGVQSGGLGLTLAPRRPQEAPRER